MQRWIVEGVPQSGGPGLLVTCLCHPRLGASTSWSRRTAGVPDTTVDEGAKEVCPLFRHFVLVEQDGPETAMWPPLIAGDARKSSISVDCVPS